MRKVDINELRRLHEAATKGEWAVHPNPRYWVLLPTEQEGDSNSEANAAFVVAAHNAIPGLLDELEAAQLEMRRQGSVIAELREEVRRLTQANGDIRKERDQLRAELEKLRGELDDAEERADEAERACAAEWEKDCGQALRILAQVTKFEWDQDGSPADEVREHIQMTLESLEKQVLSLRAELAAAKERGDGLYLGLRQTLEALGGVAQPGVSDAFLILGVPGEAAAIKRLNTALAAHVERMEKVLGNLILDCQRGPGFTVSRPHRKTITEAQEAISSYPAKSLAAHDAALLRRTVNKITAWQVNRLQHLGRQATVAETMAEFVDEADRIAKGGPHA